MKNEEFNEIKRIIIFASIILYLLIAILFIGIAINLDKIENKIDTLGTVIQVKDCKF